MSRPRKRKKLPDYDGFSRFLSFQKPVSSNSKKMERQRTPRSGYSSPRDPSPATHKGWQAKHSAAKNSPVNKSVAKNFALNASHKDFPAKDSSAKYSPPKESPANGSPPKKLASTVTTKDKPPISLRFAANRIVPDCDGFSRFLSFQKLVSSNSKTMDRQRTPHSGYSSHRDPSPTTLKGSQAKDSAVKNFSVNALHKDFPAKDSSAKFSTRKESPAKGSRPKNLASTVNTADLPPISRRFAVNGIVPGLAASQCVDLTTRNKCMNQAPIFNSSSNMEALEKSLSNFSLRRPSSQIVECQQKQTSQVDASQERGPESKPENHSFDIFEPVNARLVKLQEPLHALNKAKKRESERFKNTTGPHYLRSGMVLLKNFINIADQVKVLRKCRDLGIGSGGFYRPGYRNGSKLHLQMMCLGKDWDPDSRLYKDSRIFDDAVPPEIPGELRKLVDRALQAAHNFLRQSSKSVHEIPSMSPDVCIVNFYNHGGKLGLHQDIDESKESIEKGLPVVSFSIGDSADFLYGDARDPEKAERVILESGDVLIFGGESRRIFHGVPSIIPHSVPTFLTSETALRPGRLNLTFRQVYI